MTGIVVDKSTNNATPHSIYSEHNINSDQLTKKFFKSRAEKGIAWHIDVVWTLMDNGKLANQIARWKNLEMENPWHCVGDLPATVY